MYFPKWFSGIRTVNFPGVESRFFICFVGKGIGKRKNGHKTGQQNEALLNFQDKSFLICKLLQQREVCFCLTDGKLLMHIRFLNLQRTQWGENLSKRIFWLSWNCVFMRDSFSLRNISVSMFHEYLVKRQVHKNKTALSERIWLYVENNFNGIDIKSDGNSVLYVILIL